MSEDNIVFDTNYIEKYSNINPETGAKKNEIFSTAELRAYKTQYIDPLTLNFKLMIDYSKPSGLFAKEDVINSALAYLKRIGENERFNMLKRWIEVFQNFIKNYDFLILTCDGISEIVNAIPYHAFTNDHKITLTIRETSDMLVQSLLTTYRHIWFDDIRCVEVLPANLRKFDINILIYSSGYFNMSLYDSTINSKDIDEQTKIFPTIRKLSDKYFFYNAEKYEFNHHLVEIKSASINNEESGKSFFETISNEVSDDYVKNTMVFNFRFAGYKGVFNNIFGEIDFVKELAIVAAYDSLLKKRQFPVEESPSWKTFFKNVGSGIKTIVVDEFHTFKDKPASYVNKYVGKNTVIGKALTTLSDPMLASNLIKQGIDLGIQYGEDKIDNAITKINNLILTNFSDPLAFIYKQYADNHKNKVELIENIPQDSINRKNTNDIDEEKIPKNVEFGESNIYTRKGF
jgi:hypothetical protein